MDPMDEFEFRPITSGLGFHNQKSKTPTQAASSTHIISPPLPRNETHPTTTTVDDILLSLNKKRALTIEEAPQKTQARPQFSHPENYNASAILLDTLLVIAGTLACLIALLVITKSDVVKMLASADSALTVYGGLGLVVAGLTWSYLVATRVFLGATPGEWIFDQQLGRKDQWGTVHYAAMVVVRSTLVVLTGIISFPVLSILFNTDVLGYFLKIDLQKKA